MVTDLRTKLSYKKSPIVLLLIFIWVLVVCFVSVDFYRETAYDRKLQENYLHQFNLRVADVHSRGDNIDSYINSQHWDGKPITFTLVDLNGSIIYSSAGELGDTSNISTRGEFIDAKKTGLGYWVGPIGAADSDFQLFCATKVDDYVFRSSQPYSLSFNRIVESTGLFVIFIIGVTILMSILGFLMMRRLRQSLDVIEQEHESSLHHHRETIRIKRQLTSNINHELKTPISAIHGYLETIIQNPEIDPKIRTQFLEKSLQQSNRLIGLLKDVSEVAKMEEGNISYQMEPLKVKAIIEENIASAALEVADKGIRIKSTISDKVEVIGNEYLVRSIFGNLIDNAVAYSGARDIFIRLLKVENGMCYFAVSDNGIGVDPQHLPHLFERFYRVDNGRSRKIGGTGLGLAIVKNAVQIHGGTISVANRERGGLEFIFSIKGNIRTL